MATQRLSMSEAVWARTRRKAFDLGISASLLAERALVEYLDREEGGVILSVSLPPKEKPPAEVAVAGDKPVPFHRTAMVEQEMPWNEADGGEVIPESIRNGGIVINDPLDAERVAREVAEKLARPVRPVPKPVRRTRTRR